MFGSLGSMPNSSRAIIAAVCAVVAAQGFASGARAQSPSPESVEEARALFVAGQDAAQAGLWADAVVLFTRSYDLVPTSATLFNLAVAARALGRHLESRDALARLLSHHADDLEAERRREVERLLAVASSRIARLVVQGLDPTDHHIELDGELAADPGERPLSFELDPGSHSLRVGRDGYRTFTWEGTLGPGAERRLDVALEPLASGPMDGEQPPDPPEPGGSVFSSPLFWTLIGVFVVGGAAGLGILLYDDGRIEPQSDRRYTL